MKLSAIKSSLLKDQSPAIPLPCSRIEIWSKLMVIGCFFATAINFSIGLHFMGLSTAIATVLYGLNVLYIRNVPRAVYSNYVFYILTILLVNIAWFYNYGSKGSILYAFIILYAIIFLFASKFEKNLLLFLLTIDYLGMFFLEYFELIDLGAYESENIRVVDMYLSLFVYVIVFMTMIRIIKKAYFKEKQKAEEVEQLKQNFLTNLNHEIRTPINIINGFSQLFENTTDVEKQKKYANVISQNTNKLLMLVGNIIELSEIQQGRINLHYIKVNVNAFLREELAFLKTSLEQHNRFEVVPSIQLPDMPVESYVDIKYLKTVVENILLNAVQHTNSGEISILFKVKKKLLITIKDTGSGMEYRGHDELSNSFNRKDESTETTAGVGLSISKTLVRLMGGEFELSSEEGLGTCVTIKLPFLKQKPEQKD